MRAKKQQENVCRASLMICHYKVQKKLQKARSKSRGKKTLIPRGTSRD